MENGKARPGASGAHSFFINDCQLIPKGEGSNVGLFTPSLLPGNG